MSKPKLTHREKIVRVPAKPRLPLWEHQQIGVEFLERGGVMLAWEPGTGKTLPAATFAAARLDKGPVLILCLPSVRLQLRDELERFFGFEVLIYAVPPKGMSKVEPDIPPDADFVVCAFTQAVMKPVFKALSRRRWSTIIVDEAHAMKNPAAQRTRMLYGARANSQQGLYTTADRTILLTGTPVTKDPMDLHTHYSRLFPEAHTLDGGAAHGGVRPLTRADWESEFCVVRPTAYGSAIVGSKNLDKLREVIAPYVDRVVLGDVIKNMPSLIVDTWPIEGAEVDLSQLDDETAAAAGRLAQARDDQTFADIMAQEELALATLRRMYSEAKATAAGPIILDWLHDNPGQKALIFGLHPAGLRRVARFLRQHNRTADVFDGLVSHHDREEILHRFRNLGVTDVLCIQTQAGGTGLNLQAASRVFLLDAAWTPGPNEQAIARAYRAGQTRPVHATYFSLANSIDERVARVLRDRTKMIKTILS